jgi:hypothetical protein
MLLGMSTGDTVEIVTQPVQLAEDDALEQVRSHVPDRIRSTVKDVEPVRAVLRYKPFYAYDVRLIKRVFRGDDDVTEGSIVVDAMADVARPFTEEDIEETETSVPADQVFDPEISEDDAELTANSRRMQVAHRERGDMEMDEEPSLVYKPVWLVELANGEVRVVDGVDGAVFSDMLLG